MTTELCELVQDNELMSELFEDSLHLVIETRVQEFVEAEVATFVGAAKEVSQEMLDSTIAAVFKKAEEQPGADKLRPKRKLEVRYGPLAIPDVDCEGLFDEVAVRVTAACKFQAVVLGVLDALPNEAGLVAHKPDKAVRCSFNAAALAPWISGRAKLTKGVESAAVSTSDDVVNLCLREEWQRGKEEEK